MPLFLLKHCSFFFLLFLSMQKQRSWKFSPSIPFFSHRHDTGRTACSIHSLTASLAAQHRRLSSASHARRALLSDFVIVCQRSRPLGTRERSSRYHNLRFALVTKPKPRLTRGRFFVDWEFPVLC